MLFGIDIGIFLLLLFCLGLVCVFEFVNGSHDTANAVSPVIYSHSLKPKRAVILAAVMNFVGVTLGGITVAMGIIHLLPLDLIAEQGSTFGICVVLSLLFTAILWNAGTWYLGLPASSSHTLIGSIFGVGIAISLLPIVKENPIALNWHKVIEVIESLIISPLVGFGLAFGVMSIAYIYLRKKDELLDKPKKSQSPSLWLRSTLIASSAWVSYAHGSNDGQKGVGLAMLILISLVPQIFALNPKIELSSLQADISFIQSRVEGVKVDIIDPETKNIFNDITLDLSTLENEVKQIDPDENTIRKSILQVQKNLKDIENTSTFIDQANAASISNEELKKHTAHLYSIIDYAPWWIVAMISISLGIGTMFGRKRIVKTLGKKIGNHKMNYAESTSSALITALTITIASHFGLPVSTTHIFSSSIAGCMMTGKKSGVQQDTVKHILLAWLLTLPITIVIAGLLFSLFWIIFL